MNLRLNIITLLVSFCVISCAQEETAPAVTAPLPQGKPGAHIQIANPLHNFGKVFSGQVIETEFVFTNTGLETLTISKITPACGCTTAAQWDRTVEPGKVGRIPIKLDTTRFTGPLRKTVQISSNAKNLPTAVVTLNGEALKAAHFNPPYAAFGRLLDPKVPSTKLIRITSELGPPFDIKSATSTNKAFVAELKTVTPGRAYDLTVKTVPPLPLGFHRTDIQLQTTLTELPAFTVVASALVSTPILTIPNQIALPPGRLPSNTQRNISVKVRRGQTAILSKPSVSFPGIKAELHELKPQSAYVLKVFFDAGFILPKGKEAIVTIPTNLKDMPVISVPVTQVNP